MNLRNSLIPIFSSTLLFVFLFHKQVLGINLLIYEFIMLAYFLVYKAVKFDKPKVVFLFVAYVASALFTVVTHSVFSYFMHFIAFVLFIGSLIYPGFKSVVSTFAISFTAFLLAQFTFIRNLADFKVSGYNVWYLIKKFRIFVIPVVIILFFIGIYRLANPVFEGFTNEIINSVADWLFLVFKDFDFTVIFTALVGLIISNYLIYRILKQRIVDYDLYSSEHITRVKVKHTGSFGLTSLKNELKAAVFLLLALNFILLIVNFIDIYWVWFNFEWNGQYLKQFVHEGTYLLILSVLVSMFIVLYFFNGNLNFYRKNNLLKFLSYLWLSQNAILTFSVAIRNFWYINYFALAYKRIGVIIFLILVLFGLVTILLKLRYKKSLFYLMKTNALALYIILLLGSFINWDVLIARYNIRNADKSFLHLNFLAQLSDKTLPDLDISIAELNRIQLVQKELFPPENENKYMEPVEFKIIIEERKLSFKNHWESKSILSWNWAEYKAYKRLFVKR